MKALPGYRLIQVELYNWGNFHRLQIIPFSDPLIHPRTKVSPHAMIVGINGSGKSTIMDGVIATLLPDERYLKLGVVHDSDKKGKSSRTVDSYVLGKFGSSDLDSAEALAENHGRKTGHSAILLKFQHEDSHKCVTVGRHWWFSDHRVKEDQVYFVFNGEMTIAVPGKANLVNANGEFFENAKSCIKALREKFGSNIMATGVQSDYMRALGGAFGINKDILILLMKAAYVKSIDKIDPFIRENMLIETEKESLERFRENISKGREISDRLQRETRKFKSANNILDLTKETKSSFEKLFELETKLRLASALETRRSQISAEEEINEATEKAEHFRTQLPILKSQRDRHKADAERLSLMIATDNVAIQIQQIEHSIKDKEAAIARLESQKDQTMNVLKTASIELKEFTTPQELRAEVKAAHKTTNEQRERLRTELFELKAKEDQTAKEIQALKAEIDHLKAHKTTIRGDLYNLKLHCKNELGLADTDLMFAGELIDIPKASMKFERAIKAVLNSVATKLIVNPTKLTHVDHWVNANKLKSTLRLRRLRMEDMADSKKTEIHPDSVLAHIVLRDKSENPYTAYLWKYLMDVANYRIVGIDEFESSADRVVTINGYMKGSVHESAKLKDGFDTPLGWDSSLKIRALENDIRILADKYSAIRKQAQDLVVEENQAVRMIGSLQILCESGFEFLNLDKEISALNENKEQLAELNAKSPALKRLKSQLAAADEKVAEANQNIGSAQKSIEDAEDLILRRRKLIGLKKDELDTCFEVEYSRKLSLVKHFGDTANVLAALDQLFNEITKQGVSAQEFIQNLRNECNGLGSGCKAHRELLLAMRDYKSEFADPNIDFTLDRDETSIDTQMSQWTIVVKQIESTGLPQAREDWERFYSDTLLESAKSFINDFLKEMAAIKSIISAINQVLLNNTHERLPTSSRYLQIALEESNHEQIKDFNRELKRLEGILRAGFKAMPAVEQSKAIIEALSPFMERLQDEAYRTLVVDARNHFKFKAESYERGVSGGQDKLVEVFRGAERDAKSSAQTTQLAYTLLASALAYRLGIYDPERGKNTLRILPLDEFGGKFDSEKPKDIVHMLTEMGFQAIMLTPFGKVDLLRPQVNRIVAVNKIDSAHSVASAIKWEELNEASELPA